MHTDPSLAAAVHRLEHPLAAAQLSLLRAKTTSPHEFRGALKKLALLLLMEAARTWEECSTEMESPLGTFQGSRLARPVVLVPILRAGLGREEGMMALIPEASTGHVGIYRDHETLRPIQYFSRFPPNIAEAQVLVLDPMLATGHSAAAALSLVKETGAQRLQFICVVACPSGIATLRTAHPEVRIITAAVDPELNGLGYVVPGLGDAGDRYFGT